MLPPPVVALPVVALVEPVPPAPIVTPLVVSPPVVGPPVVGPPVVGPPVVGPPVAGPPVVRPPVVGPPVVGPPAVVAPDVVTLPVPVFMSPPVVVPPVVPLVVPSSTVLVVPLEQVVCKSARVGNATLKKCEEIRERADMGPPRRTTVPLTLIPHFAESDRERRSPGAFSSPLPWNFVVHLRICAADTRAALPSAGGIAGSRPAGPGAGSVQASRIRVTSRTHAQCARASSGPCRSSAPVPSNASSLGSGRASFARSEDAAALEHLRSRLLVYVGLITGVALVTVVAVVLAARTPSPPRT